MNLNLCAVRVNFAVNIVIFELVFVIRLKVGFYAVGIFILINIRIVVRIGVYIIGFFVVEINVFRLLFFLLFVFEEGFSKYRLIGIVIVLIIIEIIVIIKFVDMELL